MLDGLNAVPVVMLGFSTEKIAGRHRESVCKQVRKSQGQDDPRRKLSSGYPTHYCEGRDRSIDPAIDPVTQIVVCWSIGESFFDRLNRMFVFHLRLRGPSDVLNCDAY